LEDQGEDEEEKKPKSKKKSGSKKPTTKKEASKKIASKKTATKKEASKKKDDADRRPGVINSILSIIREQKGKSFTREVVLDRLCELFPDRDRQSMYRTIQVQIPSRINNERDIHIEKLGDGKYKVKK